MRKTVIFVLLFISLCLYAGNSRLIITTGSYFPGYKNYEFKSPILVFNSNADIYNIFDIWGIGGTAMLKYAGSEKQFKSMQIYRLYIHRFENFQTPHSYFLYGLFGGIKNTNLLYIHHSTREKHELKIMRPLIGYHFSSEIWGATISWTQSEEKKSVWEYELKFRESNGTTMQIGGSLKGPIPDMKSGFYITFGYEFFL